MLVVRPDRVGRLWAIFAATPAKHTPTPLPHLPHTHAGERWAKTVESLRQNYDVLTGDMLLAAAFISYAGPFTNKFRASLIKEWIKFLSDHGAPMSPGITGACVVVGVRSGQPQRAAALCTSRPPLAAPATDPLSLLVDSAMMASWVRQGLPSDPTSMQNGMILCNTERWPLMMDPQLQGVVWIKEREAKNNLQVSQPAGYY